MEALSPAARDVLRAQLHEISPGQEVEGTRRPRKQYPDHRRLCHRAAVSFRLAPEYGLGMPDGAVALGQIRMVRLIYGFQKSPQGVMKPRASLAFLCPGLDIPPKGQGPGSGRIVWQIAPNPYDPSLKGRLWDLCSVEDGKKYTLNLDKGGDQSAARVGVILDQACCDYDRAQLRRFPDGVELPLFYFGFDMKDYVARQELLPGMNAEESLATWRREERRITGLRAWPAWMFARDPRIKHWPSHPVTGEVNPWDAGLAASCAETYGDWIRIDGVATPGAQLPFKVYAVLDHLAGREVRNPAFHVLKKALGFATYGEFPEEMTVIEDGERLLRGDITRVEEEIDTFIAEDETLKPEVRAALAAACEAVGIRAPETDAEAVEMLTAPWNPQMVDSPGIQVFDLPAGATLEGLWIDVPDQVADLYEHHNIDHGRYEFAALTEADQFKARQFINGKVEYWYLPRFESETEEKTVATPGA